MSKKRAFKRLLLRLRQYRTFLILLGLVAAVWLVVRMSTQRSYQIEIPIDFAGLDTARYAIMSQDTAVEATVEADGFAMLSHHFLWKSRRFEVDASRQARYMGKYGGTIALSMADYQTRIRKQFASSGRWEITDLTDSVRVRLKERCKRAYVPRLTGVAFDFGGQRSLSGEPRLTPDSVYLYGSEESLARIQQLEVKPVRIKVDKDNGYYALQLEPVWQNYPDVRPSTEYVRLMVPAQTYTEKELQVPVRWVAADTSVRARLYPSSVKVVVRVPQSEYMSLSAEEVAATVHYDPENATGKLAVSVEEFPKNVRVKDIAPAELQYVIIR